MARGWTRGNNYERRMISAVVLEAAKENYELPTYLLPSRYCARTKAETLRTKTTTTNTRTDCLGAQIRTSVRGRLWGVNPGQRVFFTAIYIGAAMPRGPVRRETVSFLEKLITGVDQRRGDDLPFGFDLTKEGHKKRSVRFSQWCKIYLTFRTI